MTRDRLTKRHSYWVLEAGIRDETTLFLSSSDVNGRIVALPAHGHNGYKITIESHKPQ